jgi:hypothetical protein
LTIASGATPIGSAGRAPDEIFTCIKRVKKAKEDLDSAITTIGREIILVKVGHPKIFRAEIVKQTQMPWLKHIMKVRPQDPSCVAWYMHMDALC